MRLFLERFSTDNRLTLTFYLTLAGSSFLAVFGTVSLFNNNPIFWVLYIGLGCGLSNLFLLTTSYRNISRYVLAFIVLLISLALIITGGQEGTGHLWTYPLITIAFAILTMREGLWFCIVYLFLLSAFLFVSFNLTFAIEYEAIQASRYFISMLALCAMILVFVRTQEKSNTQLKVQSVTDNLTGLFNRAVLSKNEIMSIQPSAKNVGSCLLLIDIDQFKRINDTFGHTAGDEVLIVLADLLKTLVRSSDLAIRWGGEEFLLVLKECPASKALLIAEKIKNKFECSEQLIDMLGKSVTLSIGISKVDLEIDFTRALELADANLYSAKNLGRNRVIFEEASKR